MAALDFNNSAMDLDGLSSVFASAEYKQATEFSTNGDMDLVTPVGEMTSDIPNTPAANGSAYDFAQPA